MTVLAVTKRYLAKLPFHEGVGLRVPGEMPIAFHDQWCRATVRATAEWVRTLCEDYIAQEINAGRLQRTR